MASPLEHTQAKVAEARGAFDQSATAAGAIGQEIASATYEDLGEGSRDLAHSIGEIGLRLNLLTSLSERIVRTGYSLQDASQRGARHASTQPVSDMRTNALDGIAAANEGLSGANRSLPHVDGMLTAADTIVNASSDAAARMPEIVGHLNSAAGGYGEAAVALQGLDTQLHALVEGYRGVLESLRVPQSGPDAHIAACTSLAALVHTNCVAVGEAAGQFTQNSAPIDQL